MQVLQVLSMTSHVSERYESYGWNLQNMHPAQKNRTDPGMEPNNDRVAHMLTTAKTKADLQHLVRSLDQRNMALQRINESLRHELALTQKETK